MSDSEEDQRSIEATLARYAPGRPKPAPKVRYQSTKGDDDKRKLGSSAANMEKARQAKLAGLAAAREQLAVKQAKKAQQREIVESDSDDSESEDEDESEEETITISKKGRGKGRAPAAAATPLTRADLDEYFKKKQPAKKKAVRKTIIHVAAPAAAAAPARVPNAWEEVLKRSIFKV